MWIFFKNTCTAVEWFGLQRSGLFMPASHSHARGRASSRLSFLTPLAAAAWLLVSFSAQAEQPNAAPAAEPGGKKPVAQADAANKPAVEPPQAKPETAGQLAGAKPQPPADPVQPPSVPESVEKTPEKTPETTPEKTPEKVTPPAEAPVKPVVHMPELPQLDDPVAVQARVDHLELQLRGLKKLVTGELPEGLSLPEIFEIDILDPAAVARRRSQLGEQIAAIETRIAKLEQSPTPVPDIDPKPETQPSAADEHSPVPSDGAQAPEGTEGTAKPGAKAKNKPGKSEKLGAPQEGETAKPEPAATKPEKSGSETDATTSAALPQFADVPAATPELDVHTSEPAKPIVDVRAEEIRVLQVELQVARARLKVLILPLETRKELFTRDQQRRNAEHAAELAQVKLDEAELVRNDAEKERLDALREAEGASSEKQRELAEARAAAEGLRRDLADLSAELATSEAAFHNALARDDDPITLLLGRVEKAVASPKGRDLAKLFDELAEASKTAREQLASALYAAENDPPTPKHDIELPVIPDDEVLLAAERDRLVELLEKLEVEAETYVERALDLAHLRLAEAFEQENNINRAMIRLLDHLPSEKRAAVLGFGPEGIAQLRREVTHLGLAVRWYRLRQRKLPERVVESLRDTYTLIEVVSTGAQLLALLLFAMFVVRRRKSLFERLRANLVRVLRRAWLVRPLQATLAACSHLTPGLMVLLVLTVTWRRLIGLHEVAELRIVYEVLFAYTLYRLCLTAAHRGIAWMIRRRVGPRSENFHTRLYRSLRLIGRTVLLVVILLTTSRYVLGTGHLYRLVAGFAWLCSIPIGLYLIRRWQDDIASAYLRYRDRGALADAVRNTRVHWYGFFVALAAVFILLVVGTWRLAQGFILGFDQSRRALAFFFRRRLERHASEASIVGGMVELPSDLVRALRLDATGDERLIVKHFPKLDEFKRLFDEWKAGHETIGAVLVVADSGYGKTSWLKAARQAVEHKPVHHVELKRRLLSQRQVLQCLARELEVPDNCAGTMNALANWLRAGPRRIVMLDDAHQLYLRGVGTFQAWSLLMDLIERTGNHVFWVCSMGKHPYDYLVWARRGQEVFRATLNLGAWSEQDIAALIHQRVEAAGYDVLYDDLIVDRVEGVEAKAQLVSTEREYSRLIWDYADGCPKVALHCWRNSLVLDKNKQVRVRLFRRPTESLLEQLNGQQQFLLASLIWHETLTVAEAMQSLRYARIVCQDTYTLLTEWGVLEVLEGARYQVTTPWLRAVNRYLRRHHLLP